MARKRGRSHKISGHFSIRDFVDPESGTSSFRISLGLVGALELLRSKAKQRVNIVRGYHSQENDTPRGFHKEYHSRGLAADVTVDNMSAKSVFLLAEEIKDFGGIGLNLSKEYVHVDTRKEDDRALLVIVNGKRIDLTPENRQSYLGDS